MLSKYDWILFDLDNTLLDFSSVSKLAFSSAIEELGVSNKDYFYKTYSPINAKYWHYFEKGKISAEELQIGRFKEFSEVLKLSLDYEKMGDKYLDFLVHHSEWIVGAKSILEKIQHSHQSVIITNGLSKVQHRRLEKHEMKLYFEHIFVSEEMGVSKPNIAYFEKVHHAIGNPQKSRVLVIGDNPNSDIKGGRNFGYDTCWFDYKNEKKKSTNSTYRIREWAEII